MAKLFDTYSRIVPTWLAAAQSLYSEPGRSASNYVLEITDTAALTVEDKAIIARVNSALVSNNEYPLQTVAGTIFPLGLSKRFSDREELYAAHKEHLKRGKAVSTWGTYFGRMIERPALSGKGHINPLEMMIKRLGPQASNGGAHYASCYELGVSEPEIDFGGEIPTLTCELDGRRWYGGPCLSHLSFKKIRSGTETKLNLTAVYRSHHYCARSLGNLIGLCQLLSFVARNSELRPGVLTCVSTHAELDVSAWGGVSNAQAVLHAA